MLATSQYPHWGGHNHLPADIDLDAGHLLMGAGTAYETFRQRMKEADRAITVDCAGQIGDGQTWPRFIPWDRFGRIGACFGAGRVCYYIRGEAAGGYEETLRLQRFDRHIRMVPDDEFTCLLIDDRVESGAPHQFEWLLHSNEPAVKIGKDTFRLSSGSRAATVRMLGRDG